MTILSKRQRQKQSKHLKNYLFKTRTTESTKDVDVIDIIDVVQTSNSLKSLYINSVTRVVVRNVNTSIQLRG